MYVKYRYNTEKAITVLCYFYRLEILNYYILFLVRKKFNVQYNVKFNVKSTNLIIFVLALHKEY
jgi:hypothetical protein